MTYFLRPASLALATMAPFLVNLAGSAQPEAASSADTPAAVLEEHCIKCHGPEKQKSGLRLDSREALLQGGDSGPAVVPGDAATSLLATVLRPGGDIEMPPAGFLEEGEVAALEAWINEGALWPETVHSEAPVPAAQTTAPAIVAAQLAAAGEDTGPPVDFNREVRPILSEHCFNCHGPDARVRKAGLRLDDGESAYAELKSGHRAVVPAAPQDSALIQRIFSTDADEQMPPASFEKPLTEAQRETLRRWVAQGAEWAGHWAFDPPAKTAAPVVSRPEWPRNGVDSYILAKLDETGLAPRPEAEKARLLRRVSLDLTGLPPSIEELDAFLADDSPGAYERQVDRLLASPRYGEQMARYWLDLARYADTNGYHIDNERYMWRWRDWVIDAYNENKPFDEFTIEQLAGDLLPDATLEQKIATGFNRNHMINFEGGAIPEEYHMNYIVDRVDATSTVWLGLTTSCAQCHDHKYDPISQKEFYQFYAFFNQVPEKGLDGNNGNAAPFIKAPTEANSRMLEELRAAVDETRKQRNAPMPQLDAAQAKWEAEWRIAHTTQWESVQPGVIEELPAGEHGGVTELRTRTAAESITALRLSVRPSGLSKSAKDASPFALQEITVETWPLEAPDKKQAVSFSVVNTGQAAPAMDAQKLIDGDRSTGWAPGNGQQELLLVAESSFGAAEGAELRISIAHNRASAFEEMGVFQISLSSDPALAPAKADPWYVSGPYAADSGEEAFNKAYPPEAGVDLDAAYEDGRKKWTEAVPALGDGATHDLPGGTGASYLFRRITSPTAREMDLALGTRDAVKVWLNGAEIHTADKPRELKPGQDTLSLDLAQGENELLVKLASFGEAHAFHYRPAFETVGEIPFSIALLLETPPADASEKVRTALRDFYRRENSEVWRGLDRALADARDALKRYDEQLPTSMVMARLENPRDTFILMRGEYDNPGEQVEAATLAVLPPLPEDAPRNRLGLARWLVDSRNPLTARVTVNRIWQRFFGTGIVKSASDFGAQGEWPSHPALLDWLAVEFVESGWDVKALQRLIVTSATYRQSSRVTPELLEVDPENRLLARGPRYRLDAEVIRDNALAISGLLKESLGGASVRPHQPPGLWKEVAYGGGHTAQVFKQDEGDANYRRSMYTFWKRQAPPPNLVLFDAPNRETCVALRERTNTPLQALALMNDRQYVEAARAFAERILDAQADDTEERIDFAFRAATARTPNAAESAALAQLLETQQEHYAAHPEAAKALLSNSDIPPGEDRDPVEWAAWTMLGSTILNLDEVISKL